MSTDRRMMVAVALIVLLAAGWIVRGTVIREEATAAPVPLGRLLVDGPSEIEAGAPWRLVLAGARSGTVIVDVWGSAGVRRIDLDVVDGLVSIPGDLTEQSGRMTASLSTADATGEATVEVVPGRAVDGIVPLAGPRSMIADGAHRTMVTAIPVDRYGNAVADGTPVRVHVRRPDGRVDVIDSQVEDLLAGIHITSTTTAGRSTIRVSVDGATGPEVEVLEVPGRPVEVTLQRLEMTLRADGRTLYTIETGQLADRFGNELLDGTAAEIATSGTTGAGSASSTTIDGRAEFVLEAPPEAGTLDVTAVVDGVVSEPLLLEFVADVAELPAVARRIGDRTVVEVGPVLTALGGFAPDGTTTTVTGGRLAASAELRDGVARLEVEAASGDPMVVEVLGVRTEVSAP